MSHASHASHALAQDPPHARHHPLGTAGRTSFGDDLIEPLNGPRAYWHGEQYAWTRSAWNNVCRRAGDRRQLRLKSYERRAADARYLRGVFRGLRARMAVRRGPPPPLPDPQSDPDSNTKEPGSGPQEILPNATNRFPPFPNVSQVRFHRSRSTEVTAGNTPRTRLSHPRSTRSTLRPCSTRTWACASTMSTPTPPWQGRSRRLRRPRGAQGPGTVRPRPCRGRPKLVCASKGGITWHR